jgi:hypothetical protein
MSEIGLQLSKKDYRLLEKLYDKGPGAYGSIENLAKQSKLPKELVSHFLHSKESYNRYHNATRKFKRLSAYASYINDIWCMDLAHVEKLSGDNNGVNYLLVCVDIFSRFVRVHPMKNKFSTTTTESFKKFKKIPNKLWVDRGKEFEGEFKKHCKQNGITIYHTNSETKAAFAERAIRSLKRIIYRFMEEKQTYKYINRLPNFVSTMNNRVNRSTGIAPSKVKNTDALIIHHFSTGSKKKFKKKRPKFQLGDSVCISKVNLPFRKGYKAQYTKEIFTIYKISSLKPVVTYQLKDKADEKIVGKFYEPELKLVIEQDKVQEK